jgi:hypothetical protein
MIAQRQCAKQSEAEVHETDCSAMRGRIESVAKNATFSRAVLGETRLGIHPLTEVIHAGAGEFPSTRFIQTCAVDAKACRRDTRQSPWSGLTSGLAIITHYEMLLS